MVPKEACDVIRAKAEHQSAATTTTHQDLTNALALIDTAVRAIRQAEPVMTRFLGEVPTVETIMDRRIIVPIFCKALELMRTHESRLAAARAALENVI